MIWLILLWVGCGVLSYGITFAFFQREWPSLAEENYSKDALFAIFIAPFGPISLLVVYFFSGCVKHGFKWK